MKKHINIQIAGFVQGVGFRYWTRDLAFELSIKGYVRNLPNGDVYISAEGEAEMLEVFINKCYDGLIRARVKRLTKIESAIENIEDFIIV